MTDNNGLKGVLLLTTFLLVATGSAIALCPKDEKFIEKFENVFKPNKQFKKMVDYPTNLGATGVPNSSRKLSTRVLAGSLYSPIVCRPREHYGLSYSGECDTELYPNQSSPFGKGEMAAPCNPSIEAKYYAQRPILNYTVYEKMLDQLLESIQERVPEKYRTEDLIHPSEFCPENCYTDVMKFIMKKINFGKKHLQIFKEYAKNDTWGGEQFAFWNEKVFIFTKHSEQGITQQQRAEIARYNKTNGEARKYIVSFTLHNTLRSSSMDIIATVFEFENRMYLERIEFASKKNETGKGVPEGISIGRPGPTRGNINLNNNDLPSPESPEWIFMNTIENKTFNVSGFHDPDPKQNITIPGGYPPEFEDYLNNNEQAYLLKPGTAMFLPGGYDGDVVYPNMNAKGGNKEEAWHIRH